MHWLLVRCQRHTSRVQEAFVGFGEQKPTLPPAHVSLVKQSMLLRRVRKEPYVVQAIAEDFEEHAEEDHPGATMLVEVWDAAHVPEGVIPEGTEVTSYDEVAELAKAIAREHHSWACSPPSTHFCRWLLEGRTFAILRQSM